MKPFRICLLVVLALLLPLRGITATAMACPTSGHEMPMPRGMDTMSQHQVHDHAAAQVDDGSHDQAGHQLFEHEKCKLCCDVCSVTPPIMSLPTVLTPQLLSAVRFPDLFAPAPSFLSGSQERPPRCT